MVATKSNVVRRAALLVAVATVMLFRSAIAHGVEAPEHLKDTDRLGGVTTGAANRARADVQIRRIKNLIITKKSDDDRDYQRLEKLQKELHGQR